MSSTSSPTGVLSDSLFVTLFALIFVTLNANASTGPGPKCEAKRTWRVRPNPSPKLFGVVKRRSYTTRWHRLRLTKEGIEHPATPHMLAGFAAMPQDLDRVQTRLLQSIAQDWHAIKGEFSIDSIGKRLDRGS